jgi:tRNA(adenine34) deaminase
MNTHEDYMKMALEEARLASSENEVPVGAIGLIGDRVIAQGHNEREKEKDPLAHAEMVVIAEAASQLRTWRLTELTVYVTLEPCLMCMGALLQGRIPRLIFGAMDPKAGACGSLYNLSKDGRLNHQIEVVSGILAKESSKLLKEFFQTKRS